MLAILLIGVAGSSLRSHCAGLKASLRRMLVFGPVLLLAFYKIAGLFCAVRFRTLLINQ
jgi:hypothetical protein